MELFKLTELQRIEKREADKPLRPRILLVDDEATNRMVMRGFLFREFELLEASDGEEAWQRIMALDDRESLACVISDQRMPNLTGVQLFQRLQPVLPLTTRILVTGFIDVDVLMEAINQAEIYRIIAKPFDSKTFIAVVKQAVAAHQQRRALEQKNQLLERELDALRRPPDA